MVDNWLPIIFAVAITIALAYPVPGKAVVSVVVLGNIRKRSPTHAMRLPILLLLHFLSDIVQEVNIGIVFFLSGLAMDTKALMTVKGSKVALAYGFVAILLLTPLLGFVMRTIPLEPKEFSIGLVLFCVVPTTLGIGVALVRSCKGNDSVALLLTVASNILGVFIMPPYLQFLFLNYDLGGLDITVNIPILLLKLVITILVPSLIGKLIRDFWKAAEAFAKTWKTELGMFATFNLAMIVWQTLSGARDTLFASPPGMITSVGVLAIFIYLFYLLINFVVVVWILKVDTYESVAIVIMSSQKSAPVAMTLISYITGNVATQGLLAIPSVIGQIAQIFIGSAMAPSIAKRIKAFQEQQKKEKEDQEAAAQATNNKEQSDAQVTMEVQHFLQGYQLAIIRDSSFKHLAL